jgi:alpha-N-acetylglucosaminidase
VANTHAEFAQSGGVVAIAAGGEDLWRETSEYAAAYKTDALGNGKAVSTTVQRQDGSSPYSRAGLMVGDDLSKGSVANLAVTPDHGCMLTWDSDGNGQLDTFREVGGFTAPVHLRLAKDGDAVTGACSSDGKNWSIVGTATVPTAEVVDVGLFVSAVNRATRQETIATFSGLIPAANTSRDGSADPLQSLRKPVSALSSEPGRPPEAANDGSRANSTYWGGPLELGNTWWQVDLGTSYKVSRVNVRNYVDGTRYYTYRLEGSLDGQKWFTLGGRSGPRPADNAGDTALTHALARYVRVVGIGNTANGTFHLTEVSVYGITAS